jgi:hypothetical protein
MIILKNKMYALTSKIVRLKLFVKILFTCATNVVYFYTYSKDMEIQTTFLFFSSFPNFIIKRGLTANRKISQRKCLNARPFYPVDKFFICKDDP